MLVPPCALFNGKIQITIDCDSSLHREVGNSLCFSLLKISLPAKNSNNGYIDGINKY